jgi:hypothetical protein
MPKESEHYENLVVIHSHANLLKCFSVLCLISYAEQVPDEIQLNDGHFNPVAVMVKLNDNLINYFPNTNLLPVYSRQSCVCQGD